MQLRPFSILKTVLITSKELHREVKVDLIAPAGVSDYFGLPLLLVNDGQDLAKMSFSDMVEELWLAQKIAPMLIAAIHAGPDRKMEYGVAGFPDYLGRGGKATAYRNFIKQELLPQLFRHWCLESVASLSVAGFSLGGLSALDLAFDHRLPVKLAGVFSGSLWWRSVDQTDPTYDDAIHRIMHRFIRESKTLPEDLRFYFQCGALDEVLDRNKNGIIDSIDDTRDLIKELVSKGFDAKRDIQYVEMPDGKHDIATWARALPPFLIWGWGS